MAYHASCHLCRELGVKEAPRAEKVGRVESKENREEVKKTIETAEAPTVEVKRPPRDTSKLSENELKIYSLFPDRGTVSADELSRSGFSVGVVLQNLTMLEIKGFIKAAPGGVYSKT